MIALQPSTKRNRQGAALLIAVAILAILTVFAVVFSIQSRVDMDAATNFSNNVRADLMADAAAAIAISFLDHNRDAHPTITSLDQAAFTYFNGTWIGGKQWAFFDPVTTAYLGDTWLSSRNVLPYITGDQADALGDRLYIPRAAGPVFDATIDWDSADGDDIFDPATQPFLVVDPDGVLESRTRMEQLHQILTNGPLFTDVDNDEDGFRDSMYIPIPADRIFGGVDQDGDGETDGVDNNFDGFIDEPGEAFVSVDEGGDGIDNDLDGFIDEAGEFAPFLYWGGNDGLDNDLDGAVDEFDEQKIFLTAPIRVPDPNDPLMEIELLADGVDFDLAAMGYVDTAVLVEYANATATSDFTADWQIITFADDIDRIDNDYDLIANNHAGGYFELPGDQDGDGDSDAADLALADVNDDGVVDAFDVGATARRLGLNLINLNVYTINPTLSTAVGPIVPANLFVAARGEPVCNIAGRVAILITDESSKVNIDIAGGHMPNEFFDTGETNSDVLRPIRRALSQGIGTHEYDLRTLPDIGNVRATRIWDFRTGISNGDGLLSSSYTAGDKVPDPVNLDVSLPGYGGVDDNMSSVWMAVNGLDDDGDADIYQNDGIDNNLDGNIDEPGEGLEVGVDEGLFPYDYDGDGTTEYANFEGTDEPGEFQLFRPLRNVVSEDTSADEDDDGVDDEFGEASDRVYRARDQLKEVTDIGPVTYANMRNLVTAHSLDGGGRYQYFSRVDGSLLERPQLSGLKLNLNYATSTNPNNLDDPGQIARMFIDDFYYPPSTADAQLGDLRGRVLELNGGGADELDIIPYWFMAGMRQEDVGIIGVPFYTDPLSVGLAPDFEGALPPDQELRALRLAATLQDFRDRDHVRTTSSIRLEDPWWAPGVIAGSNIDDTNGDGIADFIRQIEYKVSGIESIRINEIMVRPTRRIEAEGTPGSFDILDPNQFLIDEFDYEFTPNGSWAVSTFDGAIGERTVLSNTVNDEIAQFRFRPSVGLPPGRYYLLINITDENGDVSVLSDSAGDIEYAIKYVAATDGLWPGDAAAGAYPAGAQRSHGDTDIITDVNNSVAGIPWRPLSAQDYQTLPLPPVDRDTGMVFLGTEEAPANLGSPLEGYTQNSAFTVEIPPFQGGPNVEQVELVVALRRTSGAGEFSINYFEFSQDPDHEYIEIVNIEEPPLNLSAANVDDYAIDLSGWQIEVGDQDVSSDAVVMTIPAGTLIAPGDTLLLAVNKFDGGIDGNGRTLFNDAGLATVPDIAKNGIGLARGPRIGAPTASATETTFGFGWTTEPPMPRVDPIASAANGWNTPQNYTPGNDLNPPTPTLTGASVFFRPEDRDMVDGDGDGNDDYNTAEPLANASVSTPDPEPTFGTYTPTFNGGGQTGTDPLKAWDRIVQLEIGDTNITFTGNSRSAVADLVLRGGVFPNYPENDGIDNDGDNAVLENDAIDNDGDNDPDNGLDADNDGLLAELETPGNDIDDDHDGFVDEASTLDGSGYDEEFEGYDEGHVRRYVIGATGVPVGPVPGSYDDDVLYFTDITGPDPVNDQPDYLSNELASPDWKAFVERRFYPGDNVIVTLYEGTVDAGRVVDRVTYNQRDVENVAIDDDVDVPFVELQLNVALDRAWLPNTMGLDFYRSLERKHPLYAGDRYGTRNRWTATDGDYDDWSRGTNRFDPLIAGTAPEFLGSDENDPLFTHGLSGSPLRMNFYQRVLENANFQFGVPDSGTAALAVAPNGSEDTQWMFDRARIRNRNLASAGDLMTMAHMSFAHSLYDSGGVFDAAFEATPFKNISLVQLNAANTAAAGPLVGMDFPKDLQALVTSSSFDELNLSVGQADFYPIYPTPAQVIGDPELARWDDTAGVVAPRAWAPMFLYPLDTEVIEVGFTDPVAAFPADPTVGTEQVFSHLFNTDAGNYPFHEYFMFERPENIGKIPAGTTSADMALRWPLDRRAVTYVATNPPDFNPRTDTGVRTAPGPAVIDTQQPSEALFVWQAEDGLQNGRYDAYVVTLDNLDDVGFAHIDSGSILLTEPGVAVVDASSGFDAQDLALDVAFLTDLNGDRRCWDDTDIPNGIPDRAGAVDEINFDLPNPESYGVINGMIPSREGIMHYGAVEVKNNYLALFVRNWGVPGFTNRVTRVILAPRRATSGRININTAVTRSVDVPSSPTGVEYFNPLFGIPGTMLEANGFVDNSEAIGLPDTINQALIAIPEMEIRSEAVLANRQERGVDSFMYPNGRREFETPYSLLSSSRQGVGFYSADQLQYPLSLYFGTQRALALEGGTPLTPEERFDEMRARMSRMANFVTTRSDVFEIIITAQPGYVADNNGDGIFNWRDDSEFVTTGEVKRRIIYERSQGDPDAVRN